MIITTLRYFLHESLQKTMYKIIYLAQIIDDKAHFGRHFDYLKLQSGITYILQW